MYMYVNSTIQRCPNKIIKIFLIEDFLSFATGVNDTGGQPWAANTSANFRKNSKRSYWNTVGLGGNWLMKKTRSKKSRDTVPLNETLKLWYYGFIRGCTDEYESHGTLFFWGGGGLMLNISVLICLSKADGRFFIVYPKLL